MTTDALTRTHCQPLALSFEEMQVAAQTFADSNLFPAWDTPAKMLTLMLLCRAEGRDPVSAVNRYDNIQGRVAKRPLAMLEDFIAAGGQVEWLEATDKVARATFIPPNGKPLTLDYTWEQVVRAGLDRKENYRKYPEAMLRARLISAAMRMVFPGATSMLYGRGKSASGTGEAVTCPKR